MKKRLKHFIFFLRNVILSRQRTSKELLIVMDESNVSRRKYDEVKSRLAYFDPSIRVSCSINSFSLSNKLNNKLIGLLGYKPSKLVLKAKEGLIFDLDYETNFEDGWEYHHILYQLQKDEIVKARNGFREKLRRLQANLMSKYNKAYILGTGPSLSKASEVNWQDGIRIVSNTIVKDKQLWNHINPHFIVAGDAIYHYGLSKFAETFRKDLKARLTETDTYFVFQEHFYPFIKKEFKEFSERLIPIPVQANVQFHIGIEKEFKLPHIGNVLNGLLLPLSTYLSDNVYLWGFDGRAPSDQLFWKNSDQHFYSDLVPELQKLHPAFFTKLVPKENPEKYVQSVHGDELNNRLTEAEQYGISFNMMHPSYTKTLMDRYKN